MSFFKNVKDQFEVEQTYKYNTTDPFAKIAIQEGGSIHPLIIPSEMTGGTGLMNPSILSHDGKLKLNIRCTNYLFFHSERKKVFHPWGPLTYLHPEDDIALRTQNYYCELDDDYNITRHHWVDTSELDVEPVWGFTGLEDARLVVWDDKLYMTGVRRDTKTDGEGRMELSEIDVREDGVFEISRKRIAAPGDDTSYCEKNWMPVLDKEFTYVKWCNPTEVVEVDISKVKAETVHLENVRYFPDSDKGLTEPRGGSQVLPWGDGYIALTHEVDLFQCEMNVKDGVYRHRFILWDKNFNIKAKSEDFTIAGGHTEFSCGMCIHNEKILITFGLHDNAAYLLEVPKSVIDNMLKEV